MKKIGSGETFTNFYDLNRIYVDKTEQIYSMINYDRVFLSRPRRFGKSTILDTIATLFEKGTEPYFKGTWIYDKWESPTFPVLRLNFLRYSKDDYDSFKKSFCNSITEFAMDCNYIKFLPKEEPADCLNSLLEVARKESKKFVILIDEYDCQLSANINNEALYNVFQKSLRNIYDVMKGAAAIRFLGITGVTRLKDVSIFSVGSDIKDATYDSNLAKIAGFTREEINTYYIDYLNLAVSYSKKIPVEQVTTAQRDEVLDRLAVEYNGYCFDEFNRKFVYSTWSVNSFFFYLAEKKETFYDCYWYSNGGLPSILVNYLKSHDLNIEDFTHDDIEVDLNSFQNPTSLLTMDQNVLMCQTGYLTLHSPIKFGSKVILGIPNNEVKKALYSIISLKLFGVEAEISIANKKLLEYGTVEQLHPIFSAILNSISYEKYPITSESILRLCLQMFLLGAGINTQVESQNSHGRSDIQIDFDNRRLVLELKYVENTDEASYKLDEAKEQIKLRDYGNVMPIKEELVRIVLVFNGKDREIAYFEQV